MIHAFKPDDFRTFQRHAGFRHDAIAPDIPRRTQQAFIQGIGCPFSQRSFTVAPDVPADHAHIADFRSKKRAGIVLIGPAGRDRTGRGRAVVRRAKADQRGDEAMAGVTASAVVILAEKLPCQPPAGAVADDRDRRTGLFSDGFNALCHHVYDRAEVGPGGLPPVVRLDGSNPHLPVEGFGPQTVGKGKISPPFKEVTGNDDNGGRHGCVGDGLAGDVPGCVSPDCC